MDLPFDVTTAEQTVAFRTREVADARSALQRAEEALQAAQAQLELAVGLKAIVRDADIKTSSLITGYQGAQQERLQQAMGDDPSTWATFDMKAFQPQPLREWLQGKPIISAEDVAGFFERFKSLAGNGLAQMFRGQNRLHAFAELLASKMYVDDRWPRLCIVDNGGHILKEITIVFETSDLR